MAEASKRHCQICICSSWAWLRQLGSNAAAPSTAAASCGRLCEACGKQRFMGKAYCGELILVELH